ncbi:MAG: cytochrome c [Verrucomicrobiota bacterium]
MRRVPLLLLACLLLSCRPMPEPAPDPGPLTGRQIYMARCIACHQVDGRGIPSICPPLLNSPQLSGPPEDLIRILLLGMKGRIVRDGTTFNGLMPAWRFDLSDGQLADVINDLYARWKPETPAVTEQTVRMIREETAGQKLFPTAKELRLSE